MVIEMTGGYQLLIPQQEVRLVRRAKTSRRNPAISLDLLWRQFAVSVGRLMRREIEVQIGSSGCHLNWK